MHRSVASHENIQIVKALLGGTRLADREKYALESVLRVATRHRQERLSLPRGSIESAPDLAVLFVTDEGPVAQVTPAEAPAPKRHPWQGESRADVARLRSKARARAAMR